METELTATYRRERKRAHYHQGHHRSMVALGARRRFSHLVLYYPQWSYHLRQNSTLPLRGPEDTQTRLTVHDSSRTMTVDNTLWAARTRRPRRPCVSIRADRPRGPRAPPLPLPAISWRHGRPLAATSGQGRPWTATGGHKRPRAAMDSHGRPRAARCHEQPRAPTGGHGRPREPAVDHG